ncbi:hypothetical protein QFC21_005894 [Naganishia friedmannii]|uniref:Uncharacterized protein n=1 Tax=Naganishia friedmannii TaxID=89922 RepID=A0ACC2V7W7_9TREE|nr:hypothetical protein QFC21_005894 [Naganishia friedmannii]
MQGNNSGYTRDDGLCQRARERSPVRRQGEYPQRQREYGGGGGEWYGTDDRVPPPRRYDEPHTAEYGYNQQHQQHQQHHGAGNGEPEARWESERKMNDGRHQAYSHGQEHGHGYRSHEGYQPPPSSSSHAYPVAGPQGEGLPYDDYSALPQREYQQQQQHPYAPAQGEYHDSATSHSGAREWNSGARGQGHAHGHQQEPSEKSRDVIFLGLEPTYTEESMLEFLRTKCGAHVDKATLVRDRATGELRGFGFVSFSSQTAADQFIHAHFPHIAIPSVYPNNPPMSVKVDYAGTTAGAGQGRQGQERGWQDPRAAVLGGNEGMRDIAPAGEGNRVLLMRGLAPDSTHEEIRDRIGAEIVRLASSTAGEHGAVSTTIADGRQAIERVILIRNKHTKLCAGFGFIELATPALATALLAHLLSRTAQPVGFVINGRPVACSFANMRAFAPVGPEGVGEAWCFPCPANGKPGGIGRDGAGGWYKYWDDTCGASLLDVDPDFGTHGHGEHIAREPVLEKFLHALDVAADPSQGIGKDQPRALGTGSGLGSGPGTPLAAGGIGAIKLLPLRAGAKKKEVDAMVALPVAGADRQGTSAPVNVFGQQEEDEPAALPSKTFPGRGKQGAAVGSFTKKTASFISKWNDKQEELKAPLPNVNAPPAGLSAVNTTISVKPVEARKNLLDDTACQAGRTRKQAVTDIASSESSAPAYRDRAAERRSVFNQPAMPLPESSRASTKPKYAPAPVAPPKPEPGLEPAKDETNKGNQLLKMMGWAAGTGLGLEGEGRVAPVEALLYGERVGLGAAKGRDPTKYQGSDGYASLAKDGARQRYEQGR